MSFSVFPPEINSGLIYAGAGSGPLLEAAAAWAGLASELSTSAMATHSVITNLDSTWAGLGSAAATASVTPYIAWLQQAAATATQMSAQASEAAALFEAARSASVPPPVIAANRAMLLALIATNFFGQNTPVIQATEHQYEVMWATDGVAMDTYSGAAEANNTALPKQEPPPHTANMAQQPGSAEGGPNPGTPPSPGGNVNPGYDFSTLGGILDAAGIPTTGMDPTLLATQLSSVMQPVNTLSMPLMMGARILPMLLMQMARMGSMGGAGALAGQTAGAAGTGTLMTQIGDFVNDKLQGAVGVLAGHFSTATNTISAKLGQAASMGALKVPQAWSMAADGMVRAAPVLPATTVSAPIQTMGGTSGIPGGPLGHAMMGAMAGRGLGAVAAKAPKVMPRSPAGG